MTEARDSGAVNGGMKGRGFYDAHSEYQRRVVEGGDAAIRSIVAALDLDRVEGPLTVADYGAGTGASSVHAVRTAIAALRDRDRDLPALAIHNDVLTNDFTTLFASVAGGEGYLDLPGGPVYATAAGGSFYSQVVPSATVDIGMCSNAFHWYRDQPNLLLPGSMFFADASGETRDALARQAANDWSAFLAARAAELAPGGRLFVQGIGRTDGGAGERVSAWRLLREMWDVARGLGDDGLLDPDALDRYIFPVYCRNTEEATAPALAEPADAFEVASAEIDEVPNPYWEVLERDGDRAAYASAYTAFVRAFSESTMTTHLFEPAARGIEPAKLCDEFFARFRAATRADPDAGRYEAFILRLVLVRR
jgi:SAM-dependent methyltransferase